jgi:gliding motility-associated-like protein
MQGVSGHKRRWLVFLTGLLLVTNVYAQINHVVQAGQLYGLGVVAVPGDTYMWRIFKDYTLLIEADSTEVVFASGNIGFAVPVIWLKSGEYYFTVSAQNERGCSNLKVGSIKVIDLLKESPAIAITIDRNPICDGTMVTFEAFPTNAGLFPEFRWSKNGVKVGLNRSIYKDSTLLDHDIVSCILVTLATKDMDHPKSTESNEIEVYVYKTVADFTIAEHGSSSTGNVQLINQSKDANVYYWDFGNGQTSGDENPEVTYFDDGIYMIRLIASNDLNCVDTAMLKYKMMFKGLYIPSGFAPTASSSLPGVFKPAGINLRKYKIEIYDNWGHNLWTSTALDESGVPVESWDGTFDGKPMPQDTYLWKVEAEFRDGTVWIGSDNGKGTGKTIGTVTLFR